MFIAGPFFLLSLWASLFYSPVPGMEYVFVGLVYTLNRKLAIFEVGIIFLLKGEWGYALSVNAFAPQGPYHWLYLDILPYEAIIGFFIGALLATQISAKMVKRKIGKKAPDLLGMLR